MSKIQEISAAVEAGKSKLVSGLVQEALSEGSKATDKSMEAINANPDVKIVACSGLLTTTMPAMKETVKAIRDSGMAGFKIMVGGAPITPELAAEIGADIYTPDAGSAAVKAKELAAA